MGDSAVSLREQRTRETERALRRRARELTAERGFSGFTVEELCADVHVSRRTFFNYYASKENAVLGFSTRSDTTDAETAFVESRGDLLDDLTTLLIARSEAREMELTEIRSVRAALEKAPELHQTFIAHILEAQRADRILIARRQGWPEDDVRAAVAVELIGALIRPCVDEFFGRDATVPFVDLFRHRLAVARSLLDSPS
ncbi:TetR/AcrR family transcriptional regulator [Microbacterium aquimaris]|uniref:TetR family transcriptional regulator n=1 Tax=Microbacterium aquimaris TaxID=459816 RepID=A0ABU5N2Q0_9MICO|nr:TetR family transcriptional regulator [Microbacterium aquimaris]MDZ8160343.1 TetR family transcriptional regulator [Microbacterium aquimaris]